MVRFFALTSNKMRRRERNSSSFPDTLAHTNT
jgi:hypothetical protein